MKDMKLKRQAHLGFVKLDSPDLPPKRPIRRVTPAVSDREEGQRPPGRSAGPPHERPVPIAVALKHEPGDLPKVVASGRGALAEKILEIAFAAGIKVREDADLAQLLAAVEANCPIPIACFEAVAEILNYLYAANAAAGAGQTAGAGATP